MDLNSSELVQEELKYAGSKATPVFQDLSADIEDHRPTCIDSLCMKCHEQVSAYCMIHL